MAQLLRQPILLLGADVLVRPPRRIAVNTPASSSLRAPAASFGLLSRDDVHDLSGFGPRLVPAGLGIL